MNDKIEKFVLNFLEFTSRAVFYIPKKKDNIVVKTFKVAGLMHSAYDIFIADHHAFNIPSTNAEKSMSNFLAFSTHKKATLSGRERDAYLARKDMIRKEECHA